MHKLVVLFFFVIGLLLVSSGPTSAITASDPPISPIYSTVFITGLQVTDKLDVLEIYNESSDPVNLSSWLIQYPSSSGELCQFTLNDWLLPGGYLTLAAENGSLESLLRDNDNIISYTSCPVNLSTNFYVSLNDELTQDLIKPSAGAYVRKGLTKTYRSGKFSSDFVTINRSLFAGPIYSPPALVQLQFSEALVNSRNCSPLETATDCSDYVKIYNPSPQPIDLSYFRIRNGYLGQNSTSSNTLGLDGVIEPGHFIVIPMSVTNGASWLWLEDLYGVKVYDNTVLGYPDGSSDTKKGQAWAYDESDGVWKWTTQPTPLDGPSIFPVVLPDPPKTITAVYAPCREGQYRSEETNRCRSVVSAVASLMPCEAGKVRNPVTNRCKSTTAVLGASTLTPCKPGQERNPETNRCRKVSSPMSAVEYAPKPSDNSEVNVPAVASVAVLITAAFGYALWEWRSELATFYKRLLGFFKNRQ